MGVITLNYTLDEMKAYLVKEGYVFETVEVYEARNAYHNDVEYTDYKIEICYLLEWYLPECLTEKSLKYHTEQIYGIQQTFTRILQKKLLNL